MCVPFERNGVSSTPTARGQFVPFKPGGNLHMDLQRPYESSDEDDLPPRRVPNARRRIQDTPDPECSPDRQHDTAPDRERDLLLVKYIDDFNCVEKVGLHAAKYTYPQNKTQAQITLARTTKLYEEVKTRAGAIGMKINGNKAQTLCLSLIHI